ncbi:SDR family NAD(P)-dependent oxidoreductase [Oleiharenicola lentus]|uniref:SDR family NAD(P)-dependent oxidoreductase n=1 Tax=Oleiharenicola lentus TaxID=2508720 RepID=UPI003F67DAB7
MSATAFSARYRTAFITGASTGLGKAFVDMLLLEGVEVWGTSRDAKRLPVRANFHPVTLELGDGDRAEKEFLSAEKDAGGFDIVINNAGFGAFGAFAHTEFAVWEEQMRVMLINTARLSHVALRQMLPRGRGALVNISSIAGEFGMPYQAAYNTVKAGLSMLNESLMYELKDTGVIVIDFRPGDYRTDFEASVRLPKQSAALDANNKTRMARVWAGFVQLMQSGPSADHAAASLKNALLRGKSGTVRTGRFFQAVIGPFLARFGSLAVRRRAQEKYFGL